MDEGWLEFLRQQFPKGSRVRLDLPLQSQKDRETGCHGILTEITADGDLRMQRHNGELLDVPFSKGLTILPPLTHTLKLYMPLTADIYEYDEYNGIEYDPVEIDGEGLREYEGQIMAALRDNSLPAETDRGLMVWFDGEDSVDRKVWSVNFNVEDRAGQLWGVTECQVTGDLEPEELDELKGYLSGQASDAWGESFEQQPIRVDKSNELYVHFWNSEKTWSIQTEEERFGPKFAEGLPELCFSTLASTGDLIIIKRGETGYYPSTWNTSDRAENKRLADYNNDQLGVTPAQRRDMEIGSMAGWDVPGADPAYNEAEQQIGGMDLA